MSIENTRPVKGDHKKLLAAVDIFNNSYCAYLKEWQYDEPVITNVETSNKLKRAGLALGKIIKGVSNDFDDLDFDRYFPISKRSREIIYQFRCKESHDLGAYRTDYVFNEYQNPKFIEITCQFSLNGFFQSSAFNQFSKEFAVKNGIEHLRVDEYMPFLELITNKLAGHDNISVIKGRDKIQSSKFYIDIFRNAGYSVTEVCSKDVWNKRQLIQNSFVFTEFMIDEIEALTDNEIKLLASVDMVNDFRTTIIAHDKRFFELLNNVKILERYLTAKEILDLSSFLIKTLKLVDVNFQDEVFIKNKDNWILKHINLGRSREIYAGLEFSQNEWKSLLGSVKTEDFVVQEWVPQRRYCGSVQNKRYEDYLTGTLLYFDDQYFGLGLFRASSHFVCNKVDNRNIAPLVVNSDIDVISKSIKGVCSF